MIMTNWLWTKMSQNEQIGFCWRAFTFVGWEQITPEDNNCCHHTVSAPAMKAVVILNHGSSLPRCGRCYLVAHGSAEVFGYPPVMGNHVKDPSHRDHQIPTSITWSYQHGVNQKMNLGGFLGSALSLPNRPNHSSTIHHGATWFRRTPWHGPRTGPEDTKCSMDVEPLADGMRKRWRKAADGATGGTPYES